MFQCICLECHLLHRPHFTFDVALGAGKTRTHCGGNIVSCDVVRPWQNSRADTRNVSEDFQKHFWDPGHKICVGHKRYARGKTRQHLGDMSAMLPPQCVLVLPAPNMRQVFGDSLKIEVVHLGEFQVTTNYSQDRTEWCFELQVCLSEKVCLRFSIFRLVREIF